jgi:hypothetical protein
VVVVAFGPPAVHTAIARPPASRAPPPALTARRRRGRNAAVNARFASSADAKRPSGSGASNRSITRSKARENPRAARDAGGNAPSGTRPVTASYSITPTENRSARASTSAPVRCSGAMYASVPSTADVSVRRVSAASPTGRAIPKSARCGAPRVSSSTFAGLRSRCTRLARCAWASASSSGGNSAAISVGPSRPALDAGAQVAAREQLHRKPRHAVGLAVGEHAHDARMREAAHHLHLAREPPAQIGVGAQRVREKLQRDGPAARLGHRAVDRAHAAGTQPRLDAEAADGLAGAIDLRHEARLPRHRADRGHVHLQRAARARDDGRHRAGCGQRRLASRTKKVHRTSSLPEGPLKPERDARAGYLSA